MSSEDLSHLTNREIRRKIDQSSELACLAIADGDKADSKRHFDEMKRLQAILRARKETSEPNE